MRSAATPLLLLLLLLVVVLLQSVWMAGAAVPPLRASPHLYEISTRPYLYALSQRFGRAVSSLSDVPDSELDGFQANHMDIVWFMGVWALGEYGLKFDQTNAALLQLYSEQLPGYTQADIIGSPYAITEYTVNPQVGSPSDLQGMRQRLNARGMRLMLDFVPNHSAVDCPLTSSHPEYYVRAAKGTSPPYDPSKFLPSGIAYGGMGWGDPWWDTAQFNYWNPDLVQARIQELLTVAANADAIRCDMAFLLLNDNIQSNWGQLIGSWGFSRPAAEFWKVAISKVKSVYPNVVFLAEVYDPFQQTLLDLGFDYVYEKGLYDRLGAGDIGAIDAYLSGSGVTYLNAGAHFVENHDEPRAAAFFGSWWRADAAALVTFTLPGMRFFNWGQFDGLHNRLLVQLRRSAPEPSVTYVQDMYRTLLNITSDAVFHAGTWRQLGVQTQDSLMAWSWSLGDTKRLCVLNYGANNGTGTVVVPDAEPRQGSDTITITDLLSGSSYERSASAMRTSGLGVVVNQWWAQIFSY